jgi:hypothetical protein
MVWRWANSLTEPDIRDEADVSLHPERTESGQVVIT